LKIISRLVRLGCYALCRTHHHRASEKFWLDLRRCQAVARIADRTASQQTSFGQLENVAIASPAVFAILRSKRIGVTSLTFCGHEMSSVIGPFYTP